MVFNGSNGSIFDVQWTFSMDPMDVQWIHLSGSNGHNHQTWFGRWTSVWYFCSMDPLCPLDLMDPLCPLNTIGRVHWIHCTLCPLDPKYSRTCPIVFNGHNESIGRNRSIEQKYHTDAHLSNHVWGLCPFDH